MLNAFYRWREPAIEIDAKANEPFSHLPGSRTTYADPIRVDALATS
jgi:hypothetical protein